MRCTAPVSHLRGLSSAVLLTDSEWTRRDSNPVPRKGTLALFRDDTHHTPRDLFGFRFSVSGSITCSLIESRQSSVNSILASGRTPDSVDFRHLSRRFCAGRACLAHLHKTAPLRQDHRSAAQSGETMTHLPCSQLDIHLAAAIADGAGWPLPSRFAPCPFKTGGNLFCCSCRYSPLARRAPWLAISPGNLVPLIRRHRESGSSSWNPEVPSDGTPACQ